MIRWWYNIFLGDFSRKCFSPMSILVESFPNLVNSYCFGSFKCLCLNCFKLDIDVLHGYSKPLASNCSAPMFFINIRRLCDTCQKFSIQSSFLCVHGTSSDFFVIEDWARDHSGINFSLKVFCPPSLLLPKHCEKLWNFSKILISL